MPRLRVALAAASCVLALLGAGAGTASAEVSGHNPCPAQATYDWMGDSVGADIDIPSLTQPQGIASYDGAILRPQDNVAYPGARPILLLQHGSGGNECALWWLAQEAAGRGYVAAVWAAPTPSDPVQSFVNATDATRSALAFVRGAGNPYLAQSDGSRVMIGGFSLGSVVASYVQQDGDPGVRAIIALDNLRRWLNGDPGGAVNECVPPQFVEVTPTLPALGFAMDQPCFANPGNRPPELKQPGFLHWRAAGLPVVHLVMRGFDHNDFGGGGDEVQRHDLAHFTDAWMDRWLAGDAPAEERLLATTVNGRPTADLLSTSFRSGVHLMPRLDTTDYRAYLTRDVTAPATRKRGKGRHLRFSFFSPDPTASFQCRLDGGAWKKCRSPKRVRKADAGRHVLRVRARDAAGNVDATPLMFRFRVRES